MKASNLAAVGAALLVIGCSKAGGPQANDRSAEGLTAPDVSPTAAPGVAFNYHYAFELPDEAIASVQETHASRCESLGIARCRITGLNYTVNDDNAVSASLTVKLAPEIARQFGKDATQDVEKADGKLRSTEFTGEDTEPTTTQATRQETEIQARIADVEKQLSNAKTGQERSQLEGQLNGLKDRLAQTQSTVAGAQQLLATTPMTFDYYGRGGISGFRGNPVWDAVRLFVSSLVTMISVILQLLAAILPWAGLAFVLYLIVTSRVGLAIGRFFARRTRNVENND